MRKISILISILIISFLLSCTKRITESKVTDGFGVISGKALLADTTDHRSIEIKIAPDNQIYSTIETNPDSNGYYSISDLPVGTYTVKACKYTYIPFEQNDIPAEYRKTTEVDMVLNRAVPELIFDYFDAKLYYFMDEGWNSMYCNYCDYEVIFHFENYDGALIEFDIRYPRGGHGSGCLPHFLKAGQLDTLVSRSGGCSSNPEGQLPPDTTVSVEARIGGVFLIHEKFDTTGAIPFETSTYDTVTVIDGPPPKL